MNLVRYNPNHQLRTRSRFGGDVFDDLFGDFFGPWLMPTKLATPAAGMGMKVDIYEKDDVIVMNAELPGLTKEDISVDVKGKLVTIAGESKSDEEINDKNCYRKERRYGRFERTFTLPFETDGEKVKASFVNGLLRVEIPKPEEQTVKKIAIN